MKNKLMKLESELINIVEQLHEITQETEADPIENVETISMDDLEKMFSKKEHKHHPMRKVAKPFKKVGHRIHGHFHKEKIEVPLEA